MTNKFNFLRFLSPENGSGMDRLCIGIDSMKSRKLFTLLFVLFLGIGNVLATDYTATYTVSTASSVNGSGDIPDGSTATLTGNAGLNGGMLQLTYGKNAVLTLTGYEGCTITGFKMSMKSNSSKGKGSMTLVAGTTTLHSVSDANFNSNSWYGSWSTSAVDVDFTSVMTTDHTVGKNEDIVITVTNHGTSNSTNSLYIGSYTITYTTGGDGGTPTISAVSNNDDYGTVSVDGTTITAFANTGYRIDDDGPYTVTAGSDKVFDITRNGNEFTVTTTGDCTVRINFEAIPTHSVTWSANGSTSSENYAEGAAISFPASASGCDGKTFVGWSASTINGETDNAPTFVTSATMGNSNLTYYAVFADVVPGNDSWELTALADLTSSDVFVLSDGSHALNNDGGTSGAPTANAITVSNDKITSAVADNLKWNVSGNATDGYTFYPNGSTTTWLYCNTTASSSSNNNIRVGTGDRKVWELSSNILKTKDDYTARYLSKYNTQDFRGYISGGFAIQCYKFVKGGSVSGYATTCCTKYDVNLANSGTVTGKGTFSANPTSACEGSTITLTATPETGYELSEWSVAKTQGTVTVNNNQFTMPGEAVTVSATFAAKHHNVVFHKNDGGEDVTAEQDFTFGVAQNLTANSWSRGEDYSFNGWNTLANGTGATYADGASFTLNVDADVDLYAQWLENSSHGVSYSGDAHITSYSTKPNKIAEDAEELTVEFTLETGYKVTAVAATINDVAVDEENIAYDQTMVYITSEGFAGDVAITFTIEEIIYTVTFDKGTGVCETASLPQAEYNANIELPVATPSAACADAEYGWTFAGWATDAVASETTTAPQSLLAAGSNYKPTSNITLYAVYKRSEGNTFDGTAGGDFYIYADLNGTKRYAVGTGSKIESTTNIAEATLYTFAKVEDGVFTIKTGTNYITYSSSTDLGTSTNAYNWTLAEGTHGTWRVNSGTSGRALVYRAGTTNKYGGYSTNNINGTEYFDVEIAGASTIYYHSSPSCTPKYNVNIAAGIENGTVSADKAKACADETVTLTATPADHYHFGEWTVSKAQGTVTVTNNQFTMPGEAVTVSATFAIDQYNVVFHKNNGGEDVTSSQTFNYGQTQNLAANAFSREGYNFGGWMTASDGTEANYADEASFTMGAANVDLYALWVSNTTRSIAYTANEHISAYPTQPLLVDQDDASIAVAFTLVEGYKVTGVTVTMGETELTSGVAFTQSTLTITKPEGGFTANISITFDVVEIVYTVTFDKGTGVCATESLTQGSYNANIQLPDATPSEACADEEYGWTFAGWATEAVGTETTIAPQTLLAAASNYKPGSDVTLYAVYKRSETGEGTAFTQYSQVAHGGAISDGKYLISTGSYTMAGSGKTGEAFEPGTTQATAKEYTIHLLGDGVFTILGPDDKYVGGKDTNDGLLFDATEPSSNDYKWKYTSNGIQNQQYTSRYLKAYSTTDFRHYATTAGVLTYLYKRIEDVPTTTYYHSTPSCCHKYTITVNGEIANGSVAVSDNLTKACAGTEITLTGTGTENAGRFKTWSITGLDSYSATTNPLTFNMPASNITVNATFDALFAITKEEQNGTLTLGANYAAAGDIVTISAQANDQYKNPVITVFKTGDENTKLTVSDGAFTMQAYPVTARVVCSPALDALDPPTLGTAVPTYQGVTLNWTGVANNNGYVLTVKQGGEDIEGLVNVAIAKDATSYEIASGLAVNTDYTYSIYTKGDGENTLAVNTPANGAFSTTDYPTVTLFYSENGTLSAGVSKKILTDFELAEPETDPCEKEFVGWSTVTVAETNVAPAMMQPGDTYQIPTNANCTLYAVYATITGGGTSTTNIAYTDTETTTNMTGNNDAESLVDGDATGWSVVGASGSATNNVGLNKAPEIRMYGHSSGNGNTITITAPQTISTVGITFKGNNNNAWVKVAGETVALTDGVYPINATSFVIGNANTSTTQVIITNIAVNFTSTGTQSNWATSCAAAPTATPSSAALNDIASAGASGTISMTYENVNTTNVTVALFNDEACTEAFSGEWLTASLNSDKNIAYTISENTSYNDARSAYIKLTAPETSGLADPAVVVIPVSQVKKAAVFANLQELVAADVNANTPVTVSFSNVKIKEMYSYNDAVCGVVFNIQKAGQDIKIYFNSQETISGWVAGGKLSGTLTDCPWKIFSEAWQLAPASGWAWSELEYEAPATVSSVVVSGTPTKTTYDVGEAFEPAGLNVHVVYSDNSYVDITANDDDWAYVTWNMDPATFAAEHIGTNKSVSVTATYNAVASNATEISGLTVNKVAVTGVTLSQNAATLKVGKKVTLIATVAPENATNKSINWSSNAEGIATVNENGEVTAVAEGSATITATSADDNTKTATCAITVLASIDFAAGDWTLVTDADELTAGSYVIIAAAGYDRAMLSYTTGNNCASKAATKSGSLLTFDEDFGIFEIKAGNKANTIALFDDANENYLYAASSSNNYMKAEATLSDNSSWSVSITSAGVATLIAQGNNTRNTMKYNSATDQQKFSAYGSTNQMADIALYKYFAPVPKVTYNKNTEDQVTNLPGVQRAENNEAIIAAGPSRSGYTFEGWNSLANGNGVAYEVGTKYTFNSDITLYAQWNMIPVYSVTYNTAGSVGNTPVDNNMYEAGAEVTLKSGSHLTNAGFFFNGWQATYIDANKNEQELEINEEGKFTMPAANVTITATWAPKSNEKWVRVTSADQLVTDGSEYVIASSDEMTDGKYYAMGEQKTNNRGAVVVTISNGILKGPETMATFVLEDAGDGKFAFKTADNQYLYAASSSANQLKTQSSIDNNAKWTITLTNGVASIVATASSNRNVMMFNYASNNQLFACYASAGSYKTLALYSKAPKVDINNGETKTQEDLTEGTDVTVHKGGTLEITDDFNAGDINVEDDATVVISAPTTANEINVGTGKVRITATTQVNKFSITTKMGSGKSGECVGANLLEILEEEEKPYIDIELGANGRADQWHAFTVPFPVDAINGIYDLDGKKLTNEVNYAIMDYHGDIRAQGQYGWKKFRGILVPGTFYLMTVDGERTTYRFMKTEDGALEAGNTKTLNAYPLNGGGIGDNGWNGVGNPTLKHGTVNQVVYVLDPVSYTFKDYDPGEKNFIVGTPFFIQADAEIAAEGMEIGDVDGDKPYYAPKREAENGVKNIKVFFGNEEYQDKLTISANEDALNEYETGKDLAKMSMTNTPKVAQISGKAYGIKLSRINTPMVNDQAEVAVSLYAPANGTYTISAPEVENADVFLTFEGSIIWNLAESAYELDLDKGTTEGYGLIMQAKAPQITTGISGTDADAAGVQKVVINDHVYILRGGEMYDVTGKAVK